MHKKNRKIVVDDRKFIYTLAQKYDSGTSRVSLKISLPDRRNDACVFHFYTWDDVIGGSPLMTGIDLPDRKNGQTARWNLHFPGQIRLFVLYALRHGWDGEKRVEFTDGIGVLEEMGWEAEMLRPDLEKQNQYGN
ncbi:hypothetical protein QWJ34_22260 [Saccharibacillus sp. CPCC 101409]|uniref:hypothetical protein n=1 Tax=Saccharibacillus sp. CPCC 101409 TaxID=3058041 RepID=UPI0026738C6B|nr:hypothetical protein [Saccharibacillus sp. CPCC 101409]MDO3412505.1 hypothetical protein [Saccharibacillus sp. CPCC 101409]